MSALARTITIIGALPPRARVEHLVRISIADVLVQHILRKRAVYQEELRIVMIPPQSGRALGIKRRVRDNQLLALVSPAVMPNHRTAVSIEPAPRSIAPPARAKEVYTRTTQVKVGMIIHASTLGRPKGKRVVSVRPYITIDNNRPRAPSVNRHLMGRGLLEGRTIIIVYRHAAYHTIVRPFLQDDNPVPHGLAVILGYLPGLGGLCQHQHGAVPVLAHQYDIRTVDNHFLVIRAVQHQYLKKESPAFRAPFR